MLGLHQMPRQRMKTTAPATTPTSKAEVRQSRQIHRQRIHRGGVATGASGISKRAQGRTGDSLARLLPSRRDGQLGRCAPTIILGEERRGVR